MKELKKAKQNVEKSQEQIDKQQQKRLKDMKIKIGDNTYQMKKPSAIEATITRSFFKDDVGVDIYKVFNEEAVMKMSQGEQVEEHEMINFEFYNKIILDILMWAIDRKTTQIDAERENKLMKILGFFLDTEEQFKIEDFRREDALNELVTSIVMLMISPS